MRFADPNALLTARQLAQALSVLPQLVNRWHTKGYLNAAGERVYLTEAGRNDKGERLFRYIDAAIAEATTGNSAKSYRKVSKRRGTWAELDRNTGGTAGQPAYAA